MRLRIPIEADDVDHGNWVIKLPSTQNEKTEPSLWKAKVRFEYMDQANWSLTIYELEAVTV